uniref:FGGY carbohydrate kinase domain containing n=1 Tax=Salarias fasciatus TaxID=181472 RepID=A0A672H7L2_SALFA
MPLLWREHLQLLNNHLSSMRRLPLRRRPAGSAVHVWPDFHGNRSPLADPTLKGMVVGLSLSQTLDDLARLYLATVQALAVTRDAHILDAMREAGHDLQALFLCGGLSKNALFVQVHANATGLPVVLPDQMEAVLVGARGPGRLCLTGLRQHTGRAEAMEKMAKVGKVVQPDRELQR